MHAPGNEPRDEDRDDDEQPDHQATAFANGLGIQLVSREHGVLVETAFVIHRFRHLCAPVAPVVSSHCIIQIDHLRQAGIIRQSRKRQKALSSCRSSGLEIPVTHYFLKRREWLAMATSSPADKGHRVAMAAQTKSSFSRSPDFIQWADGPEQSEFVNDCGIWRAEFGMISGAASQIRTTPSAVGLR